MDPQAFLGEAIKELAQKALLPGGMVPGVSEVVNVVRRTPMKELIGQGVESQAVATNWDRDRDPGEQYKRSFLERAGDWYWDRDKDEMVKKSKDRADKAQLKASTEYNYTSADGQPNTRISSLAENDQQLIARGLTPQLKQKDGRSVLEDQSTATLKAQAEEGNRRLVALDKINRLGETPESLGLKPNSSATEMEAAVANKTRQNAAGLRQETQQNAVDLQKEVDKGAKARTKITADANVKAQNIASQATIASANINANSSERTTAMTLNANSKNAALDRQQSNSQFLATLKDTAQSRIESNQLALAQLRAQMEQSRRADERADRRDERRDRLDLLQILTQGAQGLANGIGAGFVRY